MGRSISLVLLMIDIKKILKKRKNYLIAAVALASIAIVYLSIVLKDYYWQRRIAEKTLANQLENNFLKISNDTSRSSNLSILVRNADGQLAEGINCQLYYLSKEKTARVNLYKKATDSEGECYFFGLRPDLFYGVELGKVSDISLQYKIFKNIEIGSLYPGKKFEKNISLDSQGK